MFCGRFRSCAPAARRFYQRSLATKSALPVVDLHSTDHLEVLANAVSLDGPGFFYLKMSAEVEQLAIDNLQLSKEFFALPLDIKRSLGNTEKCWYWAQPELGDDLILIPSTGAGYRGVNQDANFSGDMRESFNIGNPEEEKKPALIRPGNSIRCGMGPNLWPDQHVDQNWCQNFRKKTAMYFRACLGTCDLLREKLQHPSCLGPFLGSAEDSDQSFERSTSLLGFTHYNYVDFQPTKGYDPVGGGSGGGGGSSSPHVFGIRPHQDDGLCTLLYTDGNPGLQYAKGVKGPGGAEGSGETRSDLSLYSSTRNRDNSQFSGAIAWEPVPFLPRHWIVNLGTDLFRWAQQRSQSQSQSQSQSPPPVGGGGGAGIRVRPCKATLHRVVPVLGGGAERYSMPFFYEPNLDAADPCFPHTKRYEYLAQDAEHGVVTRAPRNAR